MPPQRGMMRFFVLYSYHAFFMVFFRLQSNVFTGFFASKYYNTFTRVLEYLPESTGRLCCQKSNPARI